MTEGEISHNLETSVALTVRCLSTNCVLMTCRQIIDLCETFIAAKDIATK